MSNQVLLTFAGDSKDLMKASQQASSALDGVGKSASSASDDLKKAGQANDDYVSKVGKLGAAVDGASTAIDDISSGVQALADVQSAASDKALKLARAATDVAQAMEDQKQAVRDASQALIDGDQAAVDLTQAQLDAKTALEAYNEAVAEFGAGSDEAQQAQIDLSQAGVDVKQAQEDAAQALRDGSQSAIDAKSATEDLTEANKELHPPELQQWASDIAMYSPLLQALVGIVALVTAAQWAWNVAMTANPVGLIILGIALIIAGIVLLVKNWDKVKAVAGKAWDWIKEKAVSFWNWLKDLPGKIAGVFSRLGSTILAPFRWAFNMIADGWNATIGSLSWTVPGWIPGIGGNTISVPQLSHFHSGGVVPGVPGSEQLAVLQAGERVSTRGGGGDPVVLEIRSGGSAMDDGLVELLSRAVRNRGGDVQLVLGGKRA